ncbi:MAG TPA: hypothetical protein PLU22_03430 [Polyangiaceae bacterium]|nr:hypothetical protein [Polyangiaceae bacterium]
MTRSNVGLGLLVVTSSLVLWGCTPGGVGDPCIPEDEYSTEFSGYSAEEVNVESRSFQCETRVCLVNHFQGRVSCPYGQTQEAVARDPADGAAEDRCHIPGTLGDRVEDAVQVPVNPQLVDRQALDTVYCSCRCANAEGKTDDGANYCEKCPSGYSCTQLIDNLGLGNQQLAGAYCIRNGTKYSKNTLDPTPCDPALGNCGEAQPY